MQRKTRCTSYVSQKYSFVLTYPNIVRYKNYFDKNVKNIFLFVNNLLILHCERKTTTTAMKEIHEMREELHEIGYRQEYLERLSDERIRQLYESEYQS